MDAYFLWISVGLLTLFLLIGFLCGIIRGLKRSSLHIIFFVISIVVAFCITKTVTNAILNVTITVEGSTQTINDYILQMINQQFNLGAYDTATEFVAKLPMAIAAPILFILLSFCCYIVFDILYLIISRIAFGKKKKDFQQHKPRRWFGGAVGVVEGFLFLFVVFAPLTALTKTYADITSIAQDEQVLMLAQEGTEEQDKHLQTIPELLQANLPKQLDDAISAYNKSILGKLCGAGGLDKALFDGLSSFKVKGETIKLRSELLNLADTYNSFVVVYNNYIDANYSEIDLTKLKASIESFLNNGIFKTVVADTVQTLVVNYKFDSTNPEDPANPKEPGLVENILTDLKTTFEKEDFKAAEYLKHDILKLIDVADSLLDSNLLKDINALTDKTTVAMMEVVGQNTTDLEALVDGVFDLNLVNDAFAAVSDFLKDNLKAAGDMINVENLENTTTAWKNEISLLCKALKVLITKFTDPADNAEKTYIAYVMAEGEKPENYMQEMLKDMVKEREDKTKPLAQLLDPVIDSKIFTPLVKMVFDELDNAIESMTGATQQTNTDKLKETKQSTISAIVKVMDFALGMQEGQVGEEKQELNLGKVGAILDVLKENAYNDTTDDQINNGTKDGVFNETFVSLIWYMTGDSIDGRTFVSADPNKTATPFENAETIKNYLAVKADDESAETKTYSGYYTFPSYEKAMQDVQKLLDSAKALQSLGKTENPDQPATPPTPEQIEEAVSDVVNVFADMGEDQQNALLNAAEEFLGTDGVLDDQQLSDYKDTIDEKLQEFEGKISEDVANRLKQLLGYDVNASTTPSQPETTPETQNLDVAA